MRAQFSAVQVQLNTPRKIGRLPRKDYTRATMSSKRRGKAKLLETLKEKVGELMDAIHNIEDHHHLTHEKIDDLQDIIKKTSNYIERLRKAMEPPQRGSEQNQGTPPTKKAEAKTEESPKSEIVNEKIKKRTSSQVQQNDDDAPSRKYQKKNDGSPTTMDCLGRPPSP
ncbi:uncharacterized protein LOC110647049 [Hevea brasiliensis]|uniref:uncharacterized protein LOC110647049 n=1 Tax=Hevea brasiliensis TaxID=3981 RepID=UPI000B781B8F|nr:uncharacterized protein LOC110647049 [Hevea brasiliensis]